MMHNRGTIDANSPWVVDLADLPRSPGTQRDLDREIRLAERWGSDVTWIDEGQPITIDGTLDSVLDGVFVSAGLKTTVAGECVRCLTPLSREVDTRIDELFLYPEAVTRAKEEGDEEAEELYRITDNYLDLEQVVRDAILGELPFSPLCREDCEGLCAECGIVLRDADEDHHHETIDPRWQALGALMSPQDGDEVDGAE